MGFEITKSPKDKAGFVRFGRDGEPEVIVWTPPTRSEMAVFWRGSMPRNALGDTWNETKLELVSAKCTFLWVDDAIIPARTIKNVKDIEQFVVDKAGDRPSMLTIDMRVRTEHDAQKPVKLYFWGNMGEPSPPQQELTRRDMGFRTTRNNWNQPEICQFILNVFRRSLAGGEPSENEIDSLREKIDRLAEPKKRDKLRPMPR